MDNQGELITESKNSDGGKIIFATDVIATIAALAAADVKGVAGMAGGMVEGITEMLGRKNLTKGVKVEVGTEEAAIDISVVIKYGFHIQEVCQELQKTVRGAVETMTGLRVVEVNVYVSAVSFEGEEAPRESKKEKADKEKAEKAEKAEKEKAEKEPKQIEPPRVK